MGFVDWGVTPHTGLRTDEFLLRPIVADDAELDHAAVMETKELLRLWEPGGWPEDDFTVDANRDDLKRHQDLHEEGVAFTYTVMNPAETECLGCIYLFPPEAKFLARSSVTSLGDDTWADIDAAVYHWVKTPLVGTGFDVDLFGALVAWMTDAWPVDHNVFVTNEQLTAQLSLIEAAGLTRRFVIQEPGKPVPYLAYG